MEPTEYCQNCRRQLGLEEWQPLASNRHAIALVFRFQRTPGEILVIPRRHVTNVGQLSLDEGADFYALALASVATLTTVFEPDGFNMWAGGKVPKPRDEHVHLHICARKLGEEYFFGNSEDLPIPPIEERERLADRLIEGFAGLPPERRDGLIIGGSQTRHRQLSAEEVDASVHSVQT